MTEADFDEFLNDIQHFIKETPELLILIKKRYKECSKSYTASDKFRDVLHITQAKIESNNSKVFVHLRDFLNDLKINKAAKTGNKKRKRRGSGSDNSEAPSPKSLRENSTDPDTDCSEAENNSLLCGNKILQHPDRLNKLSLKHKSNRNKGSDDEKDIQQHLKNTVEAVIENNVLTVQHPNKVETVNNVGSHSESPPELNGECRPLDVEGITNQKLSEGDELLVQKSSECNQLPVQKSSEGDKLAKQKLPQGDQESNQKSPEGDRVSNQKSLEGDQLTNQQSSEDDQLSVQKSSEDDLLPNQKSSKGDPVSLTLDVDGDICMIVENVGDTQEELEDVKAIKRHSGVSASVLEDDCITIDDDDDDDDDDDLKFNKPTEEKNVVESGELKKNTAIKCSKSLKLENAIQNSENKKKKGTEEKNVTTENTQDICEELENETSAVEISESVKEQLTKGKLCVELKKIEILETECTETSKKFSVAQKEDKGNDLTKRNEGNQMESMLTEHSSSNQLPVVKGSKRQIRRLEKLLEDIRNKIEDLKNADLSLDALGEEDSAYIQEDRYQCKFVKVWKKLCELKGAESTTGRPVERRFFYKGTRYPEINRKLEKFINKHKIFPDFHDVQKVIRDTNKNKKLGLSGPAVDRLAREAFQDIGDLLQKRRISDLRKTSPGHLPEEQGMREDPALRDPELKKRLDDNRKVAKGKLDDILEKFCKRQEENPEEKEEDDKKSEDDAEEEEEEDMESAEKDEVPEMIEKVKYKKAGEQKNLDVVSTDHPPTT